MKNVDAILLAALFPVAALDLNAFHRLKDWQSSTRVCRALSLQENGTSGQWQKLCCS